MEDEGEGGVGRIGDGGGRGMVRDREGVLPGVEDGEGDIASMPRVEWKEVLSYYSRNCVQAYPSVGPLGYAYRHLCLYVNIHLLCSYLK